LRRVAGLLSWMMFWLSWSLAAVASPGAPARAAESACPPVAAPPSGAQMRHGQRDARDRGFLWRVTKGGRSSYLFGTVHIARFDWMFPGPRIVQALRASDTLALELDLLDPDLRRRLTEAMTDTTEAPIDWPPALAERLARQMEAECLAPASLAALGPEMQIATLTALSARRDGLDPAYGIDLFLAGWGHGMHKTVVSLETPEMQLQALRRPSAQAALELVESGLDELESGRARPTLNRLARVWATSDHTALARYDQWCDCRHTDADRDAMKRLVDDRNPALASAIDALHGRGKRVFAAVGSLHMVGPTGLPALLARRGYRVERVAFRR
jgi:uncharacterized protein YbaP (TraB family)